MTNLGYILGGGHAYNCNLGFQAYTGALDYLKLVTVNNDDHHECSLWAKRELSASKTICNCPLYKIYNKLRTIFERHSKNMLKIPLQVEDRAIIFDFRNNKYQIKSKLPIMAHSFGIQTFIHDSCFMEQYQESVYRFCYNLEYQTMGKKNLRLKVILCTLYHHAQPNEVSFRSVKYNSVASVKVISAQALATCMFHHLMNLKCEEDATSKKWQMKFKQIYTDLLVLLHHLKENEHANLDCCNPKIMIQQNNTAVIDDDDKKFNYFTSCPVQLIAKMLRSDYSNMGPDLHVEIFNLIDQLRLEL